MAQMHEYMCLCLRVHVCAFVQVNDGWTNMVLVVENS